MSCRMCCRLASLFGCAAVSLFFEVVVQAVHTISSVVLACVAPCVSRLYWAPSGESQVVSRHVHLDWSHIWHHYALFPRVVVWVARRMNSARKFCVIFVVCLGASRLLPISSSVEIIGELVVSLPKLLSSVLWLVSVLGCGVLFVVYLMCLVVSLPLSR